MKSLSGKPKVMLLPVFDAVIVRVSRNNYFAALQVCPLPLISTDLKLHCKLEILVSVWSLIHRHSYIVTETWDLDF